MICNFQFGASPEMLALSILVTTFFLEDVAIGYAAILAAAGSLAPGLAFTALFIGVYIGDLGLYFLGAAAKHQPRVRRFIGEERIQRAGDWLKRRAIGTLMGARVIPGSRLPIYAASGFLNLPFPLFAGATAATSLTWTLALFTGIYAFGIHAAGLFGPFKYGAIFLAVLIVAGGPLFSSKLLSRRTKAA